MRGKNAVVAQKPGGGGREVLTVILCVFAVFALGALMGYGLGRMSKEDEK